MKTIHKQTLPEGYQAIKAASENIKFTMPSDLQTGSLLKTLATSKSNGRFLELGTGTGLSTAWILSGMGKNASLISVDYDDMLLAIANEHLGFDKRLSLVSSDGEDWINDNALLKFDFIFADTWHGKYLMLDEVLEMLNPGGLYILDDMLPQPNWPEGHAEKAITLVETLQLRGDLALTILDWGTGFVIAAKN